MFQRHPPRNLWPILPLLLLAVVGQDQNWDLQNYHYYDPFAWLHGRLWLDIAPAQIQTWHNPLLDVPLYLMTRAGWPGCIASLWLALPMMLALYFLLRMYLLLGGRPSRVALGALGVIAMTGAAAYAEIGTCFNDAFIAAGILGGLFVLLREDPVKGRASMWLLAGLLAGIVTGLKLTAGVYCLGLAGAAVAMPSLRAMPRRLLALLLGGIVGFGLAYGYWGTLLFHLHGDPFFPYFNQFFHSPDAMLTSHADMRFHPNSIGDAMLVPIRLLHVTHRYSEVKLRDPRLLSGMLGFVLLLWQSSRGESDANRLRLARLRALAGFFFVSFAAWAFQSGIYRYVLPLELLACLNIVLLLDWLPSHRRDVGAIVLCLLLIAATHRPSWGRTHHFEKPLVQVAMPSLPAYSMVVLSSQQPLAFAVTALPDDVPAIAINNSLMHPDRCTALTVAAGQRIQSHAGPLWLLRSDNATDDVGEQVAKDAYGLVVNGTCKPVATNFGKLRLCPLRRDPEPMPCAKPASAPGR